MNIKINKSFRLIFIFITSMLFINSVMAGYLEGEEANKKGDRATAFKEFLAAAHDGEDLAYGKLGSMYLYGLGTKKNYQQAYIWFHMSHLTGEKESERFRNAAASMMTRDEYLKAIESAELQRITQNLSKTPGQK